jgi:hypothetical protein
MADRDRDMDVADGIMGMLQPYIRDLIGLWFRDAIAGSDRSFRLLKT